MCINYLIYITRKNIYTTGISKWAIPAAVFLTNDVWGPESELVTSAFKLRPTHIRKRYQQDIAHMYSQLEQ